MEIVKASRRFKGSYLYSPFLFFGQHDIKTIVIYSDSESARESTDRHKHTSVLTTLQALLPIPRNSAQIASIIFLQPYE